MIAADLKRGMWLESRRRVENVVHLRGPMIEYYHSPTNCGVQPSFDIVLIRTRERISGDKHSVMTMGPLVSEWFFAEEEVRLEVE